MLYDGLMTLIKTKGGFEMTTGSALLSPILDRSRMKNHTTVLLGTLGAILALEIMVVALRVIAG